MREEHSVRERERDTERERERERERRKWRHHCRAKIGDQFTLSLAKNSHFSFLPSHFPSLPSRRGHHCGAEIRNDFTLSVAKKFFALFVPTLSNGASRATSDRKPKILFFPSKKWIKLIPKTIGNRKATSRTISFLFPIVFGINILWSKKSQNDQKLKSRRPALNLYINFRSGLTDAAACSNCLDPSHATKIFPSFVSRRKEVRRRSEWKRERWRKAIAGRQPEKSFLRFCRTWTKWYLIPPQMRVKCVSRIHHRTILFILFKSDKIPNKRFSPYRNSKFPLWIMKIVRYRNKSGLQ